jgi:hypothetical protein
MTVTGWDNREEAERRAAFYRSRGYRVEVMDSPQLFYRFWLRCTYGA